MKRPDGVILVSIYHFLIAVPFIIGACAIVGVPLSGALEGTDRTGSFWAGFGLLIGFLFTFGIALASILAGWGMLRLKNWGRWLAIVLAVVLPILAILTIVFFPVFLIPGIFIIWYLFQANVKEAFEVGALAAPAPPLPASLLEPIPEPDPETQPEPEPEAPPEPDADDSPATIVTSPIKPEDVEEAKAEAEEEE